MQQEKPVKGIIRFDRLTGSSMRQVDNYEYIDLTMGLDGLLYALRDDWSSSGRTVHTYDPLTMDFLWSISLDDDVRGIAVNQQGEIFGASWSETVYHFDCDGTELTSVNINSLASDLVDINLSFDGRIAVGSRFGDVVLMDDNLGNISSFSVGSDTTFVAFSDYQTPNVTTLNNITHTVTVTGGAVSGIDFGAIAV